MKESLKGHALPESWADAQQLAYTGKLLHARCVVCNMLLHSQNAASTTAGWRETQISGLCEPCFDSEFQEVES